MPRGFRVARIGLAAVALVLGVLLCPVSAEARQFDTIVSPGPLSRAHAELRGLTRCVDCHEPRRGVTAERCLACHKPIAQRMASRKGVHRAVTDECASCHAEHRGVDADLLGIDPPSFDHIAETGYALTDLHAPLAEKCSACHTTRSYLAARPVCSTCHEDEHTPTLGQDCASCHSTRVAFKDTRATFDHGTARFDLTGAHRTVRCEKCHGGAIFRGLAFGTCEACHRGAHRQKLGPTCTTCHATDAWTTRKIDHGLTAFSLVGAHAEVRCVDCHAAKITTPIAFDRCSACHDNVHRESIRDDCKTCHTETGFRTARFDHTARTDFPLVAKHDGLECGKCHKGLSPPEVPLSAKVLDYSGARAECAACHEDEHDSKYGVLCDGCHRPSTFDVKGFVHPRQPEFFGGSHDRIDCVKCHVPSAGPAPTRPGRSGPVARATPPATTCRVCHEDVHLGQVGTACDGCHAIDAPEFAAPRFSHDRAAFRLDGKHGAVNCVKCHEVETREYPAGFGTARRLKPLSGECRTCHDDPHLGQLDQPCATCHSSETFDVAQFEHETLSSLFRGFHLRLACAVCHKSETGDFPAGPGTAVRFAIPNKTCAACHKQVYGGSGGSQVTARLSPAHAVRGDVHER